MLEDNGFKNTMNKFFKGSRTAWNKFLKPAVNITAPFVGMAVGARVKIKKLLKLLQIFERVYQVVKFYLLLICMVMGLDWE